MPKYSALDFAKAILNSVGGGLPYYGPSPLEAPLREILTKNSIKVPWSSECPHCDQPWEAGCAHVIYSFVGPVFMER